MVVFADVLRLAAMSSSCVDDDHHACSRSLTTLHSTLELCSNWLGWSASPFTNSHHRIVSKLDNLDPFGFQPTGMLRNGRDHEIA